MDRYDIVIIGGGPAGLSAAITARARNKEVLVVSNDPKESPLAKAHLIDNYPGMSQVSGLNLLESMIAHAQGLGVKFCYEKAISILSMGEYFSISTSGDLVEGRAVILATGIPTAKAFRGEQEYLGRGVSYCATCDGMLYRTATVCVVGLCSEAVKEANFLAEIGAQVVFLAKEAPEGLADGIRVEQGTVEEIQGDERGVTQMLFKSRGTNRAETNDIREIACQGVFILRPSIAPNTLVFGLALSAGAIAVGLDSSTNIPGIFAAGDCTGKPLQVAKAVGEGQAACFSAVEYLG